ncbi:MAG: hypothetical protein MUF21_05640 [Gemmatimonadaceae bacterium]|nr:hypothetical protein [Gemmatimonadaceae bacterium]
MTPDDRLPGAEQRRRVAAMKEALAAARLARDDAWRAVTQVEERLGAARTELATIERRRALAERIDDAETVQVADRFAASQRETIALLERKHAVLRDEAALAERTVREMEDELRAATGGRPVHDAVADAPAIDGDFARLEQERREREAQARLAALKKRMGRDG